MGGATVWERKVGWAALGFGDKAEHGRIEWSMVREEEGFGWGHVFGVS